MTKSRAIDNKQSNSPKVLFVQYTAPADLPPIERSASLFKSKGWAVRFVGIRSKDYWTGLSSNLHSANDVEFMVHNPGGLRALRSYLRFWWRVWRIVRLEKPDVVYFSDILTYPVGLLVAMTSRTITVQHEHDTPFGQSVVFRLLSLLRAQFIRRADISINPQFDRIELLRVQVGREDIMLAYNCPLQREFHKAVAFEKKQPGLGLWHHGSLGPGRLPYSIIDALSLLPDDVTLAFAGFETVSTEGFVESVKLRAEAKGVAHRVTYHGAIPARDDLYAEASKAHVGLAIFISNFLEPMAGASNKPFDFLGCSLALLLNKTEEWKNFAGNRGIAVFCDPEDPADIAREIQDLYYNRSKLVEMASRGRKLIENEWNYETQFQPILDRIYKLMSQRKV